MIKSQIEAAKPIERKHTTTGVWVAVELTGNVETIADSDGDVTPIPGPFISSRDLRHGAESAIYITNGLFDVLEIFSVNENFPEELERYELSGLSE